MNSLSHIAAHVDRVIGSTPPATPVEGPAPAAESADTSSDESAVVPVEKKGGEAQATKTEKPGWAARSRTQSGLVCLRAWLSIQLFFIWLIMWPVNLFRASDGQYSLKTGMLSFSRLLVTPYLWLANSRLSATNTTTEEEAQAVEEVIAAADSVQPKSEKDALQGALSQAPGPHPSTADATIASTSPTSAFDDSAIRTSVDKSIGTSTSVTDDITRRRSIRIAEAVSKKPSNGSLIRRCSTYPPLEAAPTVMTPPRPLVPKNPKKKTLVLDLDETLIHSYVRGGRMSSGHMVEVKLAKHAILYYVHKRPHCDYFLKKVCTWYNVVIFTASVQAYADPVIDWLEQNGKLFTARYYRQHCTFEDGAYTKDISICDPDLRKAMIIDNSPLSYAHYEENAIPIEGWISDPSDNDLMYMLPVLFGLRFVPDVRLLLGLRMPR